MQENWYSYCSGHQESSNSHYSESALVNSGAAINTTSAFTNTDGPVDLQGWSSTVGSIIGNNHDGSLTTLSGVAENSGSAAHTSYHPATMTRRLSMPLAGYDYAPDVHSRHWRFAAAAATADAYAPQIAARSDGLMYSNGSQVPSGSTDPDVFGPSWSQRGDVRHAVVGAPGPAQPTFWLDETYYRHRIPVWSVYLPALPETGAIPAIQGYIADAGNVGPCVADPVPGQAPSPSKYRRHRRRSHARPEYVVCNKCMKSMRPQSLKRHTKEVHDHIKRPHPKSSFAAGP